jgi:hypothetical protein
VANAEQLQPTGVTARTNEIVVKNKKLFDNQHSGLRAGDRIAQYPGTGSPKKLLLSALYE